MFFWNFITKDWSDILFNKISLQMYEKAGFIYEGELRRHLFLNGEYKNLKCYSMLKEEYQKSSSSLR